MLAVVALNGCCHDCKQRSSEAAEAPLFVDMTMGVDLLRETMQGLSGSFISGARGPSGYHYRGELVTDLQ